MRIRSPHGILVLLTLLNFVNYVDRYLVNAVSPAFQEQLGLTSFQTGLSISSFMIGYFVTSPIFGRLGDRAKAAGNKPHPLLTRTALMGLGVAVWSLATALSGLAVGATSMILARVAVGVGEASYATIAPTIIDDLAPPDRKNRWLAIFYLATPVGSALGFLLGGFIEHRWGWRHAFYVAGGPGLLLAMLVFFIREPEARTSEEPKPQGTFMDSLRALRRAPLFVGSVIGACAYTFALGGFAAWAPKFLKRAHGMQLESADFGFGVVAVLAGILGTVIGGLLADWRLPKGVDDETRVRRYLRFSAVAALVAAPFAAATLIAPSPNTFFALIFVCETALFASTSPINAVTLGAVPRALRTTAMAVTIFSIHAFGDFLSPPMIGLIDDMSHNLRLALVVIPIGIFLSGVIWWIGARARLVTPLVELPVEKTPDPSVG